MIADAVPTPTWYLVLAAVLFGIGAVGVVTRRNPLVMFMCIELMLNAVNLSFVAMAKRLGDIGGQTAVFFVLVVAAAEVVVGLGDHRVDLAATPRRHRRRPRRTSRASASMTSVVWLIPAFPLLGFFVILVFGRRLGDPRAGYLATAMVGASFVVAAGVFFDLLSKPAEERAHVVKLYEWIPVGTLHIDMSFLADPLSITMCLFVTGVGALIHLYAIGYMHGDPKFSKFFLYMNLFAFSMLVLVLGENLLVTFLGWEGVGTCSYFLISFWQTRQSAATAGKKAFVTNRVGDFGFMIAMFLAFESVGSVSYSVLNHSAEAGTITRSAATGVAALLFLGAIGKSAQLPLYFWLPDAMEGPTPVSALIHAATMVTAGVFLMVRINPLLAASASWLPTLIAWIGVITALFAATIAVAQNDIKKVLAYSTISQLGYMFLAVGSGAYVAAIFHMITHAFFKALLFLGSGSVIHGMHDAAGHAPHGPAAQVHADHRVHVHRRLAGDRRRAAVRRVLVEGRDPPVLAAPRARRCTSSAWPPRCSPPTT